MGQFDILYISKKKSGWEERRCCMKLKKLTTHVKIARAIARLLSVSARYIHSIFKK